MQDLCKLISGHRRPNGSSNVFASICIDRRTSASWPGLQLLMTVVLAPDAYGVDCKDTHRDSLMDYSTFSPFRKNVEEKNKKRKMFVRIKVLLAGIHAAKCTLMLYRQYQRSHWTNSFYKHKFTTTHVK